MKTKGVKKLVSLSFFILLISSLSFAQEKLVKPADIGNADIDKMVNESFAIYDSTTVLKEVYIPEIDKEVEDYRANIATVADADAKKDSIQADIDAALGKVNEIQPKAEALLKEAPGRTKAATDAVKPGPKAPKQIKTIKGHSDAGVAALKESVKLLPEMATQLKDISVKLVDIKQE